MRFIQEAREIRFVTAPANHLASIDVIRDAYTGILICRGDDTITLTFEQAETLMRCLEAVFQTMLEKGDYHG